MAEFHCYEYNFVIKTVGHLWIIYRSQTLKGILQLLCHTGLGQTGKQRSEKIFLPKLWPLTNPFFKSILWHPRERPPN